MSTLIIGDFIATQMHQQHKRNDELYHEFSYLTEDSGELSWLSTNAKNTISSLSTKINNVVVMIGFNDCVYSCIWDNAYKLTDITKNYVNAINDLKAQCPSLKFYVCSVIPVDCDYPHSEYSGGAISKSKLNKKIDSFNTEISTAITNSKCNVDGFIDCNKYLKEMNFSTFDGKRYTRDAIVALKNYIGCYVDVFTTFGDLTSLDGPRFDLNKYLTTGKLEDTEIPPSKDDPDIRTYYASSISTFDEKSRKDGLGKNPYNPHDEDSWFVLPNCNAYAWGRFAEIYAGSTGDTELESFKLGTKEKGKFNSLSPAEWYGYNDGYARGQEPKVGAAACWSNPNGSSGNGHIAIVEYVSEDGQTIITSESAWNSKYNSWCGYNPNNNDNWGHFFVAKRTLKNNWCDLSKDHKFMGFIYQPFDNKIVINSTETATRETPQQITLDTIDKSDVTCIVGTGKELGVSKGAEGVQDSEEAIKNALYIWGKLRSNGWSENAVAGVLGNMEYESTLNPGLGEKGTGSDGKGLVQWTTSDTSVGNPLINWCNKKNRDDWWDIDLQLERLIYEKDTGIEYFVRYKDRHGTPYPEIYGPENFSAFADSLEDPEILAYAFLYHYEYPSSIWFGHRTSFKASQSLSIEEREEVRRKEREGRGKAAKKWYERFTGKSFTAKKSFLATNLILTKQSPTTVNAAFITLFGTSGSCKLINNTNNSETSIEAQMSEPIDNISVGTFECTELVPNTEYTMIVSVKNDSSGEEVSLSKIFTTKQSHPETIKKVELLATDNKMPHNSFQIKTSKVSDWGYWKDYGKKDADIKQRYGYTIKLIVNGTVKKEKKLKSLNETLDFKLDKYFGYTPKIGDNIQIGIHTWVVDNNSETVYDNYNQIATTSNSICMLTKPVTAFLNVD